MFVFIRILLIIILFLFLFFINKKTSKHKLRFIYVIVSFILIMVLAFLPFENLFITFESPESAYHYVNYGDADVELVVEGQISDFIVGEKNHSNTYLIVPKTDKGWKVGTGSNVNEIYRTTTNGIIIHLYQYKNTEDYYITILNTNGGYATITDNCDSNFLFVERNNEILNKTFVTYYAYIHNFDTPYFVFINGNKIEIH